MRESDWSSDVCSSDLQSYRFKELSELNRKANDDTQDRIGILESVLYDKLNTLEIQIQSQKNTPQKTNV
jgi:hypothetical protein